MSHTHTCPSTHRHVHTRTQIQVHRHVCTHVSGSQVSPHGHAGLSPAELSDEKASISTSCPLGGGVDGAGVLGEPFPGQPSLRANIHFSGSSGPGRLPFLPSLAWHHHSLGSGLGTGGYETILSSALSPSSPEGFATGHLPLPVGPGPGMPIGSWPGWGLGRTVISW